MTQPPEFSLPRSAPLELPVANEEFRWDAPVTRARIWNGDHVWLISRKEDVRKVICDSEIFSTLPSRRATR